MRSATLSSVATLLAASSIASAAQLPPILAQEPLRDAGQHADIQRIPTIHESTVMARRILHLSSISTLTTTFPNATSSLSSGQLQIAPSDRLTREEYEAYENRPAEMAGSPIGLMEYYADCEPESGNPTLLAINIATPYKNYQQGSNISLHVRWWPAQTNHYLVEDEHAEDEDEIPTPRTPAALPRFSLHGYLEPIPATELATKLIPACFMRSHPDSVLWQPGNDIHTSQYVRFVVEHVYWFGGFGDRARIGWLPIDEWKGVTMDEVESMRLPGEKKVR